MCKNKKDNEYLNWGFLFCFLQIVISCNEWFSLKEHIHFAKLHHIIELNVNC